MSLLGKRRLGVSSPLSQRPRAVYQPPNPQSKDIEDLESLIRSLADELEYAEEEKARRERTKSNDTANTSGSEGTRSPDLLATPSDLGSPVSSMGDQVITPPSSTRQPDNAASRGRGGDGKAELGRGKEKGHASSSNESERHHARGTRTGRGKEQGKTTAQWPVEEKVQSTRTRSRREGLNESSGEKKDPVKRTEFQSLIRAALLCELIQVLRENELTRRPSTSPDHGSMYRHSTLHDPNNPYSTIQLPSPLPSPTYRLFHLPPTSRSRLLATYLPLLAPRADLSKGLSWSHSPSSRSGSCRREAYWECSGPILWCSMGRFVESGITGCWSGRGWDVFCSIVFRTFCRNEDGMANQQDHIWPIPPAKQRSSHVVNLCAVKVRGLIYLIHVFYAEKVCNWAFNGNLWYMRERPEKQVS